MVYVLMLLILLTLLWMATILLKINMAIDLLTIKNDEPVAELVEVIENVPSKKARVYSPGKDAMAEFSGKRDDWYGDVE